MDQCSVWHFNRVAVFKCSIQIVMLELLVGCWYDWKKWITRTLNVALKLLYTANGDMQNIIKKNLGLMWNIDLKIMYRWNFCVYKSIILYKYVKHTLFVWNQLFLHAPNQWGGALSTQQRRQWEVEQVLELSLTLVSLSTLSLHH